MYAERTKSFYEGLGKIADTEERNQALEIIGHAGGVLTNSFSELMTIGIAQKNMEMFFEENERTEKMEEINRAKRLIQERFVSTVNIYTEIGLRYGIKPLVFDTDGRQLNPDNVEDVRKSFEMCGEYNLEMYRVGLAGGRKQ